MSKSLKFEPINHFVLVDKSRTLVLPFFEDPTSECLRLWGSPSCTAMFVRQPGRDKQMVNRCLLKNYNQENSVKCFTLQLFVHHHHWKCTDTTN